MFNQRQRALVWAAVALVGIWTLAVTGYFISKSLKMTAEKVRAYVEAVDLSRLSAADRAKAITRLADMINALSYEERQRMRVERAGQRWFEQMSEAEKGQFIEATMPSGFKQMITAFEEMPNDRRRRVVDEAVRRLRDANERVRNTPGPATASAEGGPPISPELEAKVRTLGLKAFYSQSSAQTKAELAPVLEELQRVMEMGGGRFRGR